MRLKDKVAVVTGAGRGIGRATAMRFAEEGAAVIVADIDYSVCKEVVDEIEAAGGTGLAAEVNVVDMASVEAMAAKAVEKFGKITSIVNNAGVVRDSQLLKMSEENFDLVIDVNLKGVFNCTKVVAPIMVEHGGGSIINASSVVAPFGNFGQTNYVASKAGVIGMTKVWARELGRKGIRVNAIAPGFIETRMTAGIPDKVTEKLIQRVPLGRFGKPEEVAAAYIWLASDDSSYVTGHVLHVDGGTVI